MLKYRDKEVKDLGEIIKGYYNGILAFHKAKLPTDVVVDVEYWFNYNAKNYDASGRIPSDGGAYEEDMIFNQGSLPTKVGDFLQINQGTASMTELSRDTNPFNRSGNDALTIIAKFAPDADANNLFANRGTDYNYMFRTNDGFYLHTSESVGSVPQVSLQDGVNIISVVCENQRGIATNHSTNVVGEEKDVFYGGKSDGFAFFAGGNGNWNTSGENWYGDFYWIFASPIKLTENQIKQVIKYNENL